MTQEAKTQGQVAKNDLVVVIGRNGYNLHGRVEAYSDETGLWMIEMFTNGRYVWIDRDRFTKEVN